jgi:outer membrane immunogenic protein
MFNRAQTKAWSWAPASPPRSTNVAPVFAFASLLAISFTAARAADMPVKAPSEPPYNWSGCYVGLNGGAGGSGSKFNTAVGGGTLLGATDAALVAQTGGTGSGDATSALGGGQAGCNWQSGTMVYGLAGDFDYFRSNPQLVNGTNTLTSGAQFGVTQSLKTDYFATVRPRIGIAADRNLFYITGGVAFTKVNYTQTYMDGNVPPGIGSASASKSLAGWTVGAGWEYAWTSNWTIKAEYLFAKFSTTNAFGVIADGTGASNPLQGSADLAVQIARVGANYKF